MSLIVGRAESGKTILLGDSKLTYEARESNPYLDGCLKLYIVNPQLAIGFAGIVADFEGILPTLLSTSTAKELIETAKKLKVQNRLDFDLIAAQVGESHLHILKGDQISQSSVAYIGDKEGFEIYQQEYLSRNSGDVRQEGRAYISIALQPEPIWTDGQYSRMTSAFNAVLKNPKIKSVDGILVPLCTHQGAFQYMTYVDAISDPLEITKVIESGAPIDFGTAEYGSFSIELCDASSKGGNLADIGFYFLQGGFGVVFPVGASGLRRPKIVKASNPAFWVLNTSKEYGAGVASGYMTADHCGIAGEQLMSEQNWADALYCYELGKDYQGLEERTAVFDRYMSGYAVSIFNNGRPIDAIDLLERLIAKSPSLPLCGEYLFRLKGAITGQ